MVLLRLLSTGLCAACVVLLATFQPMRFEVVRPAQPPGPSASLSVLDVASHVPPGELFALVHLAPGERISAVNDRPLDSDLAAGAQIASLETHAGAYLDLTVSSATTERRVLVLVH